MRISPAARIALCVVVVAGIIGGAFAIVAATVGGPILFRHGKPAGAEAPVHEEVSRHEQ